MSGDVHEGLDEEARKHAETEPSDHSLVRRFRQGHQDAADLLYHRYADRLLTLVQARQSPDLASRVDYEDIVQSVFGSFFRGVSRGMYDVPAREELWHLFLVITLNKIRAKGVFHRAAKRDVRMTIGGAAHRSVSGRPEVGRTRLCPAETGCRGVLGRSASPTQARGRTANGGPRSR